MKWVVAFITIGCAMALLLFLKKTQDEAEANFKRKFHDKDVQFLDKNALYVARESDGYSHFRGMGYLVLTDEVLYFERQLDKKTIEIPVKSILKVERTRRLGAQSPGKLMLKIRFETQSGKEDAIAWKVKDLEQWIEIINKVSSE